MLKVHLLLLWLLVYDVSIREVGHSSWEMSGMSRYREFRVPLLCAINGNMGICRIVKVIGRFEVGCATVNAMRRMLQRNLHRRQLPEMPTFVKAEMGKRG